MRLSGNLSGLLSAHAFHSTTAYAADGPAEASLYCPRPALARPRHASEQLIGDSPAMQKVRRQIARFGPTELSVVIFGESGTGKELVARALHEASGRQGPLIAVNCGALPRELIESELFGHERGAFTGAAKRHLGCFGEAAGGTLFLDEIGELPLELQPRLLRALENRAIRPVGATREQPIDVRVIAATHRDLEQAALTGRFRADLYYRLCALEVEIPPLRDRAEDIPLLIRHFLDEQYYRLGESAHRRISDEELEPLCKHPWPGNVRQLRHALLRAIHLGGYELRAADLLEPPRRTAPPPSTLPLNVPFCGQSFAELERQIYLQALAQCGGSCRAAAELLKIPKSTLHDKLRRLGIPCGRGVF